MKAGFLKTGVPAGFLILSALVWLYILIRAWSMQLSIDESATFFMYIQTGRFIPPHAVVDANNHILNSFLSWACYSLFGSHPFVLRIPNVLAALVYFYFIWKTALLFRHLWLRWIFVVLSLGTHFVIEFFGYSRGYGLSMASFMASLYFAFELYKSFRLSSLLKASVAIVLTILSNFNLIFPMLALLLLILLFVVKNRKSISSKTFLIIALIYLFILLPALGYVIFASFQIRDHSGFYYGSGDGFFAITLESLSKMLAGQASTAFLIYALILAAVTVTALLVKILKSSTVPSNSLALSIVAFFLILSAWMGSILIQQIFQVNFQEDRTAMYYIPLFFILVISGIDLLAKSSRSFWFLSLLPLAIVPVHSLSKINLETGVYGPKQMVPEEYFEYISHRAENSEFPPVVSAWQTRKQPWAFLNYRQGGHLNPIQSSGFPNPMADFIIADYTTDSIPEGFKAIMRNTPSRSVLCEKDNPLPFENSITSSLDSSVTTRDKYFSIYSFVIPGDRVQTALVLLDYHISSTSVPLEGVFVVEAFDSNRKTLKYEAIDLDQLKPKWTGSEDHLKHSILISGIPDEATSLLLYFWNKNTVPVAIRGGQAKICW